MGSYKVALKESSFEQSSQLEQVSQTQTAKWGSRKVAMLSPLAASAIGAVAGMALGPVGMIVGGVIGLAIGAIATHIISNVPAPLQMTEDTCNGDRNTFGGKLSVINEYREIDPDQRMYSHLPISRDYVFSDPETGIVALADNTSHADHDINQNLHRAEVWKEVCEAIKRAQKENPVLTPEILRKIVREAAAIYLKGVVGTTFLIASAKKEGSKTFVDYAIIGDSRLYFVPANGPAVRLGLNSKHESEDLQGRTEKMYVGRVEVKPGDIVVGVSDGIYEPLEPSGIAKVARSSTAKTLFPNLIGAICDPHSLGITLSENPHDDVSAVGLYF